MTTIESQEPVDDSDQVGGISVKIPAQTTMVLDRIGQRLGSATRKDLIAFLADHFEASSHLGRFVDLRELQALTDRLNTVLVLVATANLEIGQHLRRIEAGHHRRLVQQGDELVLLHKRLVALRQIPISEGQTS